MNLVITEKPSVAQAIASVLGCSGKNDGYLTCGDTLVSWCVGHMLELCSPDAYDDRYARWQYQDLPIAPVQWRYTVPQDRKRQLGVLSKLMARPDVDTVICATDAGREGELIFRLVYQHCNCQKPVKRLWISSMEPSAIAEGFRQLRDGSDFDRLYLSALCRSQADWLVGMNASRLFSLYTDQNLSVGRVQTPTLAMIVEREAQIAGFRREKYYVPVLDCGGFTADGERYGQKRDAELVRVACQGKTAAVKTMERREKTTSPPKLYDLTALQRDANRLYGYTAQQTLDCAQALYEGRLITYPRTDSRYLTHDLAPSLPALAAIAAAVLPCMEGISLEVDASRVIDDTGVTDHHAILPTRALAGADLSALPTGEREVLGLIAARLLCAVSLPHILSETTAALECEGFAFTAKGKTILTEGWKALERRYLATLGQDREDAAALPELAEGQEIGPVAASIREGCTSPPKHYTEDTLLSSMESVGEDMPEAERKGLGTPATRAGIIEKLVSSAYVERKGRHLIPTGKGVGLIGSLPESIKSPKLTAEWEALLLDVERGQLPAAAFLGGIVDMLAELTRAYPVASPVVGPCPRCGNDVVEGPRNFHCTGRCDFALWKNDLFFTTKRKPLTAEIVSALLHNGRVFLTGLYSERSGKTYDAAVLLDDSGGKYVKFRLEFGSKK